MLPVQPLALIDSHEELRLIHIYCAWISHRYDTPSVEFEARMKLVKKWSAIDACTTLPSARWVTALHHETFDNTMEDSLVIVSLKAELNEIATCSWRLLGP